MTFKDKLDSHIEILEEVLNTLKKSKCDEKSIEIVKGYLQAAKKFREMEDE